MRKNANVKAFAAALRPIGEIGQGALAVGFHVSKIYERLHVHALVGAFLMISERAAG